VAVLVKDADELADPSLPSALCESCGGCRLLVPETAGLELPVLGESRRVDDVRAFEPGPEALGAAVREATAGSENAVVVAPYFALRELDLEALTADRKITFFANNWLAQGVKLKGIKRALNRAICRLQHFEREALDSFPLLRERDGIFVADLSALPEPLRLEPGRCEEILTRVLDAWVDAADEVLATPIENR
jgi:hypothetical protein